MNWVRDPTLIPAKLIAESMPERDHFSAFYDTDRYLLVSSKLGWINCDRFTEPGIVKTDLFVSVDSLFDATVRIVFNNIRSVMGGVRFTKGFNFNNIPDDESITIVAVRINNEVSELAIKECNTGSGTINDLVWYPADKNEMKRQFDNLDVENDLAMR